MRLSMERAITFSGINSFIHFSWRAHKDSVESGHLEICWMKILATPFVTKDFSCNSNNRSIHRSANASLRDLCVKS